MVSLKCIVAICDSGGIGFNNKLPWGFIKKDMNHFKKLTSGQPGYKNAVLMGTNTFFSIPQQLKNRDMFVLTRCPKTFLIRKHDIHKNTISCSVFNNLDNVLNYSKEQKYDELWCIGGEQIYNLSFKEWIFDDVFITYIHKSYKCDTFLDIPNFYTEIDRIYDKEGDISMSMHHFVPNFESLRNDMYLI